MCVASLIVRSCKEGNSKMKIVRKRSLVGTFVFGATALVFAGQANASLTSFQSFVGTDGLSTGGCGSTPQACSFTSVIPTGSTVLGAYLYSSMFNQPGPAPGGTLNGSAVNYSTAL